MAGIVARMAVPGPERVAPAWLRQRGGLGEIPGFDMAGLGDMALNRASALLTDCRDAIEDHPFEQACPLPGFAPTVALHDLTNAWLTGGLSAPATPACRRVRAWDPKMKCSCGSWPVP